MKPYHIDGRLKHLAASISELPKIKQEALEGYERTQGAMIDLQHEIELSEDYTDENYLSLVYEMKKNSLQRRVYKDTLHMIALIEKCIENRDLLGIVEVISKSESDWTRKYSPRVIKSLDFTSPKALLLSRQQRQDILKERDLP